MSGIDDRLGPAGDRWYAALLDAHDGLSDDESHALNARLVLALANEVGDADRCIAVLAQLGGAPDED